MADVRLSALTKSYGDFDAVCGIDLDIHDKEFLVLVGPSGCGKSTTLRMIAGLEEITSGELRIGDRLVNDLAPGARDIAMVFQNYALYPHMTVEQNIAFGLRKRQMTRRQIGEAVAEAARILEIEPLMKRRPRSLSGGQRQRVAMGRAIVRKPQVFLFDEPLSNLDAKLRVQMRLEIKQLHQAVPTTTIYVTHDQTEAMTMADRVVVMNNGVIEQVGPPLEIYRRPRSKFVASFIGSPSMNFFDVRLTASGDVMAVELPDGTRLDVPDRRRTDYADHVGRAMTLGIRPEAITLANGAMRPTAKQAQIRLVEPLGVETLAYFTLAGVEGSARLAPDQTPDPGTMIDLAFDMDAMVLIDPETDQVIAPNA